MIDRCYGLMANEYKEMLDFRAYIRHVVSRCVDLSSSIYCGESFVNDIAAIHSLLYTPFLRKAYNSNKTVT